MSHIILEDWQQLGEDFKKLEATYKAYHDTLDEASRIQKECGDLIKHQEYRISMISTALRKIHSEETDGLTQEILKREAQISDIKKALPRTSGMYLKSILGNVNVSISSKEAKLRYKSEYENFKLVLSAVAFVLAMSNLMFTSRRLERLYLFTLVFYYFTMTIRESILRVNGSRIKGWWRTHHFISVYTAAILLIWPEGQTWDLFRTKFMIFNVYLTVVQYLQFRYQKGVLYRLKALGERHNMDITVEGFHAWMFKGLSFLFPFLFVVYFFQFYLSYSLYYLSFSPEATWHVTTLSYAFFILFLGNITTMILIIPDKIKNRVKVLSQRLLRQKSK